MRVIRNKYISALGMKGFLTLCVSLLVMVACDGENNAEVLEKEKLSQVYAEMVFHKELYAKNPVKYEIALDSLLLVYETDTTEIQRSFQYYSKDPVALDEIYNESIRIVDEWSAIDTASYAASPDSLTN
jgi:hypothetical protein